MGLTTLARVALTSSSLAMAGCTTTTNVENTGGSDGSAGDGGLDGASASVSTSGGEVMSGGLTASMSTSGGPGTTTVGEATIGGSSGGSSWGDSSSGASGDPSGDSDGTSSGSSGSGGQPAEPKPPAPAGLEHYITGNPDDADVEPTGPGLILMGGGPDVDEAFTWWGDPIAGGDVVVIRTSGSDGYNDYLYEFDNADSVETMLVTSTELADDPYVAWTLRHAEAIWMAGGDQSTYLNNWMDTAVEDAIEHAWDRGAVVGGTSAGLAVLGEFMFAAYNDTVYSDEALEDPYNEYMTFERDFLELPLMAGVLTDSHFYERDRMGRLVGFLARVHEDGWADQVTGVGVDEQTAIVVGPDGQGTVIGDGHVYVVAADQAAEVCQAGVALEYSGLALYDLVAGDTMSMPGAVVDGVSEPLAAAGGLTVPSDPY